jgi:hypothetical protein
LPRDVERIAVGRGHWFGGRQRSEVGLPDIEIKVPMTHRVNALSGGVSDSVRCHLPIEYAADLTPVVAGKGAGVSWNARGMEKTVDF